VEPLDNYTIRFSKLKKGTHVFTFSPGEEFFKNFEKSKITKCNSTVKVTLNKQKDTFFILEFRIDARAEFDCDRCLDPFLMAINTNHRLVVKLTEEAPQTEDADRVFIKPDEDKINIAQYMYEFFNLAVPIKKTCDLSGKSCNPEVTKILEQHKTENKSTIDPRWEQLKKFYKN
jgi:uncharacterized protein